MDTPVMPEIRYFAPDVEGAEHLRVFRCEKLHATLTAEACAKRWLTREHPCSGCWIGERHATQLGLHRQAEQVSTPTPAPCLRCGRGTLKRVGGTLCISCWNRAREWILGRNRKGGRPTIALHYFEVLLITTAECPRTRTGIGSPTVCELAPTEYAIKLIAMDEAEVRRTVVALWPDAEIVEIGTVIQSSGAS